MQTPKDDTTKGNGRAARWLAGLGDWLESPPAPSYMPPPPPLPEGAPGTRTYALVKAQDDARANPDYQPNQTTGTTYCNQATCSIARHTGSSTTPFADTSGQALLANSQATELANSDSEYREVTPDLAQQLANQGKLVVAVQPHSDHGHVATVRPDNTYFARYENADPDGTGPLINNIGRHIGVVPASRAFLREPPVRYYTPDK